MPDVDCEINPSAPLSTVTDVVVGKPFARELAPPERYLAELNGPFVGVVPVSFEKSILSIVDIGPLPPAKYP